MEEKTRDFPGFVRRNASGIIKTPLVMIHFKIIIKIGRVKIVISNY